MITAKKTPQTRLSAAAVKVAIVGKPNSGKSSIFNKLLSEHRSIVTNIPGTTRDAVFEAFTDKGRSFVFIDTAGLRRKVKVKEDIEFYSIVRTREAIHESHVCLLLIDAAQNLANQDKKIFQAVEESGKAVMILLNKWDLVDGQKPADVIDRLRFLFPVAHYAEVMTTSAESGLNLKKLPGKILALYDNWTRRVDTPELNKFLKKISAQQIFKKGREVKAHYMTQTGTAPPEFLIFVNNVKLVDDATGRFFINKLRLQYDFGGCPVHLKFKDSR